MTVEQPLQNEAKTKPTSKPGWGTAAVVLVMLLLLVGGGAVLVYYGIHSRTVSADTLATQTRQDAVMAVSVVHPKLEARTRKLCFPAIPRPSPIRRSTRAPTATSRSGTWT